jgi:hypothetical protein
LSDRTRPSSFLATKGLFPEQMFRALQKWDLAASVEENVRVLRTTNTVGGPSLGWLKDFGKIILRRFSADGPPAAIVELAQQGCDLSVWKPLLLWHCAEADTLLRAFLAEWLFDQHQRGVVRVTREAVEEFLRLHLAALDQEPWSHSNIEQSSSGLLRTAAVFGLLTDGRTKSFTGYHLPEPSFMYIAHLLMHRYASSGRAVADPGWRLFMMTPAVVEGELLRLHQMHRLQFHRAGTIVELHLPCSSEREFARRMLA